MKRIVILTALTLLLAFAGSAPALAHKLTVDPPGNVDGPVFDEGVSTGWAHAHCEAAAPAVLSGTTDVVAFSPPESLEGCPVQPPPGQGS